MDTNLLGWLVAGAAALTLAIIGYRAERIYRPIRRTERDFAADMVNLNATINTLRRQLDDADQQIKLLQTELTATRTELHEARAEIRTLRSMMSTTKRRPAHGRQLLLICGDDPDIAGMDEAAISAIGLRYTRLLDATVESVTEELQRAAEDDRLYSWVCISAHAGPTGVRLAGQIVPNEFWMRTLRGVAVVALPACQTTHLADYLRDKVGFVWYVREPVANGPANRFMTRYFQRLNAGDTPLEAFTSACDTVPEVAPAADYRSH